jgi:hypothetical protein
MGKEETYGVTTMSPSVAELLPAIATLSHADKFRLVQLVLAQLAQETSNEVVEVPRNIQPTATNKSLRGCLKRYAKPELIPQEQDAWQAIASEKHEHR